MKFKKGVAATTPQTPPKDDYAIFNSTSNFKSFSFADPDDMGNSWRGMYLFLRCLQPDCCF